MTRILLGTNNRGKVIEIREVLSELPLELVTLRDVSIEDAPEETGATYVENALLKARYFHAATKGLPTIADDSGIVVEALQDELGLHTRRWGAGPAASDEEWIKHFLKRMREEPNKRAHFLCTLAFIDERGNEHVFEGRCSGEITKELEAKYLPGLPVSACFRPDGQTRVFAGLSLEQKNRTSHRGKALHLLRDFLRSMKAE